MQEFIIQLAQPVILDRYYGQYQQTHTDCLLLIFNFASELFNTSVLQFHLFLTIEQSLAYSIELKPCSAFVCNLL